MLTPNGGVFGRNPKFNNVTVENNLTVNGDFTLGDDIVINDTLLVNGVATFRGGIISLPNSAAPIDNTVLGSGAGAAMQSGATNNTCIGGNAGNAITTADFNVFVGAQAGVAASTGSQNVAVGYAAYQVGNGTNNTAVGMLSQLTATSGAANTSVGAASLQSNLVGSNNVAVGANAATLNTASDITAVGANALDANTTGAGNTAVGKDALGANTTGASNTAIGNGALSLVTTGANNVGVGGGAAANTGGSSNNVAVGMVALTSATAGGNTAIGHATFTNIVGSTGGVALGQNAGRYRGSGTDTLTAAADSIFIGNASRAAADSQTNQVVIAGTNGLGNGSNTTTIGNSSTTGTFIPAGNLTLTNGNFIVGTSGKGIDFSATANSSGTMTSELLSDYEEGTWTPTYAPQTGSWTTMTMDVQSATYTKIGRQVTVRAYIRTDNVDVGANGSAVLLITGLPFSAASGLDSLGSGAVYARNWGTTTPRVVGINDNNTSQMTVGKTATATGAVSLVLGSDLTAGAVANQNDMWFTLTYFT